MYEIFAKLMEDHNVTSYRVAKDTGVSQTTLSDWKRGRSVPKLEKLKKLADYVSPRAPISDEDIKFALFGDRDIDDDVLEEVKAFARFARERKKQKK